MFAYTKKITNSRLASQFCDVTTLTVVGKSEHLDLAENYLRRDFSHSHDSDVSTDHALVRTGEGDVASGRDRIVLQIGTTDRLLRRGRWVIRYRHREVRHVPGAL